MSDHTIDIRVLEADALKELAAALFLLAERLERVERVVDSLQRGSQVAASDAGGGPAGLAGEGSS